LKFIQHRHLYLSLVTGLNVTQNISTAESPGRYMQAVVPSNLKFDSSIHQEIAMNTPMLDAQALPCFSATIGSFPPP
jgi:hypothetical protein